MPLAHDESRVRALAASDGRAELAFSIEPPGGMAPDHPVLVGWYTYFGPVTAILALGAAKAGAETALTHMSWTSHAAHERPTHGVCTFPGLERGEPGFELELSTASRQPMMSARGVGVQFSHRDFKAWRAAEKGKVLAAAPSHPVIERAPFETVGLQPGWIPFVSTVQTEGEQRFVDAIVTREEGFPPAHPHHVGSGDHVNVPHLFDCAMQAAHLLRGEPVRCTAGDAGFQKYVELDVPFRFELDQNGDTLRLRVVQVGRVCAEISLRLEAGASPD